MNRRVVSLAIAAYVTTLALTWSCNAFAEPPPVRQPAAELHSRAMQVLLKALHEETGWVRIHAAELLIDLGELDAVRSVFAMEDNADPPLRIGVWRVHYRIAENATERREWIDRIWEALWDEDGPDRVHAAEALAKLRAERPPDAEARLTALLEHPDLAPYVAWLLAGRGDVAATNRLVDLLSSENETEQTVAAYALGRMPRLGNSKRDRLSMRLASPPLAPSVRPYVLAAAYRQGRSADEIERLHQEIIDSLDRANDAEKHELILALAKRLSEADRNTFAHFLDDKGADARIAAAYAVVRLDSVVTPHLVSLDWLVIAAYMLAMLGIGWYFSRRTETTADYLLGGRSMRPWAVGLSLFATLVSTLSYLATPGEMIQYGPMYLGQVAAYPFVVAAVGWWIIPALAGLPITSAYEILETQLGLSVRLLGSFFFLALRLLWMAVIIRATTAVAVIPLSGLDPSFTPLICAVLGVTTVIYTSIGGLRAVVYTDVAQTFILFLGAFVTLVVISAKLGSVLAWWPQEWAPHWERLSFGIDPGTRFSLLTIIMYTFLWCVCTAGSDQMSVQRYLATRDVAAARRMFNVSMVANALVMVLLSVVGLALLAYFRTHAQQLPAPDAIENSADQLFPRFIVLGLPAGVSGLVIAGILAAAMSSLSSGLSSSCSVIVTDFVDRFRLTKLSETEHLRLTRKVSWILGAVIVAASIASGAISGNLVDQCFKVVNLFVAPLFGLFVMALWIPRANALGALIGAVAGVGVAVYMNFFNEFAALAAAGAPYQTFEELTGVAKPDLWSMPCALLVQLAIGIVISRLTAKR